ncbi:BnaA07g00610D [Brassica napus]|uniref:BnaA07g00610D protein n=1 Tax=Brassica napus TaxID=3708 RepID=A0A078H3E7_BRANA|nr:BnaA07g00610D [Brassica napus]
MARRYSQAEKGKWQAPPELPAKRPPVRIPANANEDLIEANRLTIIGRLTNPQILRKGLSWAVGNGETIRLWDDPWLSFSTPSKPIGPPTKESLAMKVSDLMCPLTNRWELEKIRKVLPQYEEAILMLKTSSTHSHDTLFWIPEKSGAYSTKTGYGIGRMGTGTSNSDSDPVNWLKHVWNVKTAPKIKDFLWRLLRKAIPVSANLERRGIASFNCKKCDGQEDDLHVFLKCPLAEEVWSILPTTQTPSSSLLSIAAMIKQGNSFCPLPPVGVTSPLWPWALWNMWKARNTLIFENRAFTAKEIVLKSIKDAKEWSQAQSINEVPIPRFDSLNPYHQRSPCPPPTFQPGTLVVKVDAAWDAKTGKCGVGGIYTGEIAGLPPLISKAFSHVSSAIMAEAFAVHRAVSSAVYSNVRSLAVLSDSLSLINLLKKGEYQPELFGIIFDIYHYVPLFDVISFNFISRSFNSEADLVAKSVLAEYIMNSSLGVETLV